MLKALENLKLIVGIDIDPSIIVNYSHKDSGIDELSPYEITDGFSSLLMMNGLLIANIWKEKTGESQSISINCQQAMEMLYRPNFIHINNKALSLEAFKRNTSLTHKTKDGLFETTTALMHLHESVLNILNCAPNKRSVDTAYLSKTADEWEDIFNINGIGGAKIRTQKEFREHEQGKILSKIDPFEVRSLGGGSRVAFTKSDRPLSDLKVLDLSQIIAGPSMSTFLAEQGANVLHISNPTAERIKSNYIDTGFGKRCAALDLNQAEDLTALHNLIKEADVYVNGYAPGRLQNKFDLTNEVLMELNPNIIIVTISAFGEVGPWAERSGWENIAQAVIGSMFDHGTQETPLWCPYGFLTDYSTGLMGSIGILKALHLRAHEGGAQHVSVSLARTGMWYQDQEQKNQNKDITKIKHTIAKVTNGGNLSEHTITTETPYGIITHLKPVLEYSKTPAFWDKPTSPLGSSFPYWN